MLIMTVVIMAPVGIGCPLLIMIAVVMTFMIMLVVAMPVIRMGIFDARFLGVFLAGDQRNPIAKTAHLAFNFRSNCLVRVVPHRHCARRDGYRNVFDAFDPPNGRINLFGARRAVHSLDTKAAAGGDGRHDEYP